VGVKKPNNKQHKKTTRRLTIDHTEGDGHSKQEHNKKERSEGKEEKVGAWAMMATE
jgi:hypothetical protein